MGKTNLVIVESPAKAKTIGKYLGKDYNVKATMGHLRDLPKSTIGIDIENNFEPNYIPVKGREDTIKELKKQVAESNMVYLATDPDREGEAISWHLKELLKLEDDKAKRVTFNEITEKVVKESIQNPRDIDQNLVDAQQARRLLDRIVGYKLSPLLWKKVRRGLSAGRVQSVATRIVVDREEEIKAFVPSEYWTIDIALSRIENEGHFTAKYYGENGKKKELKSAEEVDNIEADLKKSNIIIDSIKREDKQKSPPPPFITSTLQQEASRKLGMTPKRTMSIAQQLYEGIDIEGMGTIGLITYMRTDSLRLSDEATSAAKKFIETKYGKQYYPGKARQFKVKSGAQDAHEAIRPSDINLTPELIKKSLTLDQFKLYRLVWSRFTACQMTSAVYDSVSISIDASGHTFHANHSSLKFSGYTAVYEESRDDDAEDNQSPLPDLKEAERVKLDDITKEQKFTQPPTRYTEATLIRAMEEKGIGRPSTYAPTITTILSREYVIKEGKYLKPTPLGEVVTKLMKDKFTDIVDLKFTANMEENLDKIENGNTDWKNIIKEFYESFSNTLNDAEKSLEGEHIKVPAEESNEICDLCGRKMVIKSGRFGRFLACPGFPECKFTKPLVLEMPGRCPKCGSKILKRTSSKGYVFYACEKGKDECGFITWDIPTAENCPSCGQTMFKKSGRGFKKAFCINEKCTNFTPEDKRGGWKKVEPTAKKKTTTKSKGKTKK